MNSASNTLTLKDGSRFGMAVLALALLRPALAQTLPVPASVGNGIVLLKAQAKGVQIYTCEAKPSTGRAGPAYQWVFKAPQADLFDGDGSRLGRHYAGPTWEATDGSRVVGGPLASVASPGSIPWLLLSAKSTVGKGRFSKVTYIERAFTSGGAAPKAGADAAHAGTEARVPHTATYIFYGRP